MRAEQRIGQSWLSFYAGGVYLLGVVFLSPHAGYLDGHSFLEVARSSPWERWWDWAAAWCSVKIILLSLGVFCLSAGVWGLLQRTLRKSPAGGLLWVSAAPAAGLIVGVYYLLKALL